MSFFEDQMDDWFENNCKGTPDMYDGAGGFGAWVDPEDIDGIDSPSVNPAPRLTRTQKRRAQKKRADAHKSGEAKRKQASA